MQPMQQQMQQTTMQPMQPQQMQQTTMQPQQQFVSQPTVAIIAHNASVPMEKKLQPAARSQMKVLSAIQIAVGILCILFGIILLVLETTNYYAGSDGWATIGYGIWIGLFFVIVGAFGIQASKSNTKCWIVVTMVMNILCSALFIFSFVALSATGLSISLYSCFFCHMPGTFVALNSLLLIMAAAELVMTIWCAVLCCGAACICCRDCGNNNVQGPTIQYNAAVPNQNQPIAYPSVPSNHMVAFNAGGLQYPTCPIQGPTYTGYLQQQPAGAFMMQPQAPPSYYTVTQAAQHSNITYQQPLSTAPLSQADHNTKQ